MAQDSPPGTPLLCFVIRESDLASRPRVLSVPLKGLDLGASRPGRRGNSVGVAGPALARAPSESLWGLTPCSLSPILGYPISLLLGRV